MMSWRIDPGRSLSERGILGVMRALLGKGLLQAAELFAHRYFALWR